MPIHVPGFRGRLSQTPSDLRAVSRSTGPVSMKPWALAVPGDLNDVEALVRHASREGWHLTPRGAASGMPGGNVGHGVVVDLTEGFGQLDPVDLERKTVRVGAGVVLARAMNAARQCELDFPPAPSSSERCSAGGVTANNAAGPRSFRHGSARPWVGGVEAVLADGDVLEIDGESTGTFDVLRRTLLADQAWADGWPEVRKNSSGYALADFAHSGRPGDVLVGSEGTLGILTRVELRLRPLLEARAVAVVALPTLDALVHATDLAHRVEAAACEFLGKSFLEMGGVGADPLVGDLARDAWGLAVLECEGSKDIVKAGIDQLTREARGLGLQMRSAENAEETEGLWGVRHRASPTIAANAGRERTSMQFIEDSVVPPQRLPDYLSGLARILSEARLEAVVFGHAGDGNVHVNPLVPTGAPDWRDRVRHTLHGVTTLVASLGGTLSGEHGDGRIRAPMLERIWSPEAVRAFRMTKDTLDPVGTFNPGVILPLPGQDPLEGLGC